MAPQPYTLRQANAFFCTFPDAPAPDAFEGTDLREQLPGINFWGLFEMPSDAGRSPSNRRRPLPLAGSLYLCHPCSFLSICLSVSLPPSSPLSLPLFPSLSPFFSLSLFLSLALTSEDVPLSTFVLVDSAKGMSSCNHDPAPRPES